MNTGEFEALRVHVDDARDECREGLQAVSTRISEFKEVVASKLFLQDNRIQRLESDAGRRKVTEEHTQMMLSKLEQQNAQQLLNQEIAKAERDTTVRLIKAALAIGIPVVAAILGGLVWLIQHVGGK